MFYYLISLSFHINEYFIYKIGYIYKKKLKRYLDIFIDHVLEFICFLSHIGTWYLYLINNLKNNLFEFL